MTKAKSQFACDPHVIRALRTRQIKLEDWAKRIKLEDCSTAKLVNHLTAKLEDHLTAKLMNCLTTKLEDCLTCQQGAFVPCDCFSAKALLWLRGLLLLVHSLTYPASRGPSIFLDKWDLSRKIKGPNRVVTKISSCRVNTTTRRGVKRLGISFGSIFVLFSNKSNRGPLS